MGMATDSTISHHGSQKDLAISPSLPLQAMNNMSLEADSTTTTRLHHHPTTTNTNSKDETTPYRVIFPNRSTTTYYGPLIPPARDNPLFANIDDNKNNRMVSNPITRKEVVSSTAPKNQRPRSNLSALMDAQAESLMKTRQKQESSSSSSPPQPQDCAIPLQQQQQDTGFPPLLDTFTTRAAYSPSNTLVVGKPEQYARGTPPIQVPSVHIPRGSSDVVPLGNGAEQERGVGGEKNQTSPEVRNNGNFVRINSRRCLSHKELSRIAPSGSSGSPYAVMLYKKGAIETQMTERLKQTRLISAAPPPPPTTINDPSTNSCVPSTVTMPHQQNPGCVDDISSYSRGAGSSSAAGGVRMTNEMRNKRRAEHNRAVRQDLCEIVSDLFVAESKLLNPSKYGVDSTNKNVQEREKVYQSIDRFLTALPPRYALSAETPSEVLLHMRLMQAVRLDPTRPTVHIAKVETGSTAHWTGSSSHPNNSDDATVKGQSNGGRNLMIVTIACADAVGLLEFISKLLASGGSRVLDADVMLSSDNIALDRFVVEMNGRLRLDKLAAHVGKFLKKSRKKKQSQEQKQRTAAEHTEGSCSADCITQGVSDCSSSSKCEFSGSLYYQPPNDELRRRGSMDNLEDEIKTALPLSALIAAGQTSSSGPSVSNENSHKIKMLDTDTRFQPLCRNLSLPPNFRTAEVKSKISTTLGSNDATGHGSTNPVVNHVETQIIESNDSAPHTPEDTTGKEVVEEKQETEAESLGKRRPLVNRPGNSDLDNVFQDDDENDHIDNGISIEYVTLNGTGSEIYSRHVPLIPFDELMLIETLGMGRVSTIYRAAWSRPALIPNALQPSHTTSMLALKVAMVNQTTLDTSHVEELRSEADIAARLDHPNICSLMGVAADADCFCLAYEFCERGSLLSLLSDSSRYYEYLPIALDIANGMAYLHSRNVIHRDLKPSNILLTRDNRAKISDFGMSVTHTGQELTAETGTYRYMAPEVIRHESYSSNADVYSFGICLWQLISREVPFATMTPIQAAYAVAEGGRPTIPESTPHQLRDIITACWDQDSRKRPSFTYIAMALADYAKNAFSPANIGMQTLNIANEMLATVEGNSTVNVDFSAPVLMGTYLMSPEPEGSSSTIGLEI